MPTNDSSDQRLDRRTALKWIAAATASLTLIDRRVMGLPAGQTPKKATGYGTDPDMSKVYKPGDVWPLTLTEGQRRTVTALCDLIIPADDHSPSASAVKVPDFIDEWISAPYRDTPWDKTFAEDRSMILDGIAWLDGQAVERFGQGFADLPVSGQTQICDQICNEATATPDFQTAAKFFGRFRDLTAGGFYTTPEGMKDIRYVGNQPQATFNGPPPEVLRLVGLEP